MEACEVFFFPFLVNLMMIFGQMKVSDDQSLLGDFIRAIVTYREYIAIAMTFLPLVYIYQFLIRKKKEIRLKFLMGDTVTGLRRSYVLHMTIFLCVSFILSGALAHVLTIFIGSNFFILFLMMVYILISAKWVKIR